MFQLKVTVNDSLRFFWIFFLWIIFEVSFISNVSTSFFSGGGAWGALILIEGFFMEPYAPHYGKSCIQWLMDSSYVDNAHMVLAQAMTCLRYFSQILKVISYYIYICIYIYVYIYYIYIYYIYVFCKEMYMCIFIYILYIYIYIIYIFIYIRSIMKGINSWKSNLFLFLFSPPWFSIILEVCLH